MTIKTLYEEAVRLGREDWNIRVLNPGNKTDWIVDIDWEKYGDCKEVTLVRKDAAGDRLKRCPFCGGKPIIVPGYPCAIMCDSCMVYIRGAIQSEDGEREVIKAWNRRFGEE